MFNGFPTCNYYQWFFTVSVPQHDDLYSIILSLTFLTDLQVTILIDWLIDWLIACELDSVSQPHRSHQISDIHWVSVTVSCVLIWFIDWRWKMSTDWGWGLQMRHIIFLFWLNEGIWFCLVNDNKLTKMNPLSLWWFNEACVPISPQTECTLSLLSINAILAQKSHNIYIKRTIFHLTEWLDYYWINETNSLTLVFKFNRSSNQTFFFYLTLRETLT